MPKIIKISSILLTTFILLVVLMSCDGNEQYKITIESKSITMSGNSQKMPSIFINDIQQKWDAFYYTNDDNYVYVYGGEVFLTEIAPSDFSTTLLVTYKDDSNIRTEITINKITLKLQSFEIIFDSRIYSGEWVGYNIKEYPLNAIHGEYVVSFDKPEYIEAVDVNSFKLSNTTPQEEEITLTIKEESGIEVSKSFTLDRKYNIYNASQLLKISNDKNGYYSLNNDIDLTNIEWKPIKEFYGVIDGNGFSIKNLAYSKINDASNEDKYGFIETLSGVVKDISFDGLSISIQKYKDHMNTIVIGSICAVLNKGQIINVTIKNSNVFADHYRDISADGAQVQVRVGGAVGQMNSGVIHGVVITKSSIYGKSGTATGGADAVSFVGGIVGQQDGGYIVNCIRDEETVVEALARGNSKTTALRIRAGGIIGYYTWGYHYSNNSILNGNIKAWYDIESNWKMATTSNCDKGAIIGDNSSNSWD